MSDKNQPVTKKKIRWLSLCLAAVIMLAALPLHPMPARGDTATGNITVGVTPFAIAVNPVTNKIYVANSGSNTVTVIDGADNSTATVAAGSYPYAVAINPATNKIYIANCNSKTVTVIDGANNSTTDVDVGTYPMAIAVNPVTNKIYVVNCDSKTVTVIDGANNNTATVNVGDEPVAVAVNPVTNKIYVANEGSDTVTVIDGADNSTTTAAAGTKPVAVAINPATNKIYVVNSVSNNVTVIDGADNTTTNVDVGAGPLAVAINPATNKIYVANNVSNNVTVIDGADNSTATVAAGIYPYAVAVNPSTNKIYIANNGSRNVTVIEEQAVQEIDPAVTISSLPGHVTVNPAPDFSFSTTTNNPLPVQQIWHQPDTMTGAWQKALPGGGSAGVTLPSLALGAHILYAMATDGQDSTSINTGFGSSPVTGKIAAYAFTVIAKDENDITAFTVPGQVGNAVIDTTAHTVTFYMPFGSAVTALAPAISVSEDATISPLSGETQDFTNPVTYTVTAQNGSPQDWTVTAMVSTDKTLVSITTPSAITGVANGTVKTAAALRLPTVVTLTTDQGNVQADVSWDVAACSYNQAVTTRQTFTVSGNVTLPTGVINPGSIPLTTSISVTVNARPSPPPPWYPVSGVTLDKSSLTLEVNGPAQKLAATVQPSYASYPYVYWNSSDTAVARVDNTGLVTPVAPGQAIITATTSEGGKTASCTVTVMATITATAEETIVLHDVPVSISIPPEVEATIEVAPGSSMPQVNINSSTALGTVEIQIPEGTIASGPDGWDGTFKLPTISSQPSVNINGASQVNMVIVLGLEDEQISFSQAVRILIPGQAQQQVGYIRNGVFTPITRILSADRQDVADSEIPADGDGKIDVDSDLVVWTKHFTEFVIYTPISNPKPASYTVSLSSNYAKAGTISGDGTFYSGSLITVRAQAQNGYVFDYWSENGSMVSPNSVYSFNLGESSRQLQANFVREFQELSITDATKPRIITFSHPVLPDEQNLGNIYVATDINGDNKVEGVIVAGVPGNNCQISVKPPGDQWLAGASYYLILEPGLQSALNKTLGIRTRMKFTVE